MEPAFGPPLSDTACVESDRHPKRSSRACPSTATRTIQLEWADWARVLAHHTSASALLLQRHRGGSDSGRARNSALRASPFGAAEFELCVLRLLRYGAASRLSRAVQSPVPRIAQGCGVYGSRR